MKILIIEDEKPNANRLVKLLTEIRPDVQITAIIDTVQDSVIYLTSPPPIDLIMMDIRLADGISFEIFTKTKVPCPVIFTTAYDEYALRAFKVNSIDYLLKPIEQTELKEALDKFERNQRPENPNPAVNDLLEFMKTTAVSYRTRFLLPYRDGYKTILVSDIDFIYSEFKITHLVLNNYSEENISFTLEDLEEQLDPNLFFRANRQHLICINSIKSIHNDINGKLKVILKHHSLKEIIISKEKAAYFKNWLDR